MRARWLLGAAVLVGCAASRPAVAPTGATAVAPAREEAQSEAALEPLVGAYGQFRLGGDVPALHAHRPVAFALHAADLAKLRAALGPVHPEARERAGTLVVGRGTIADAVEPRHREPSFLIDSDQPEIEELAARVAARTPAAVRALVSAHFQVRQYGDLWTASRAARLRRGDCTEHAVLVAAIARRLGMPARVIVGYVAITDEHHGLAAGHAWAQVHDGARWVDVDATPLGEDGERAYIIGGELIDEEFSYRRSMPTLLGILQATAIDVVPRAWLD